MAHVARGKLLESQGRLRETDKTLAENIELTRRGNAKFDLSYGLLTHTDVKNDLDDHRAAKDILRETRRATDACTDPKMLPELIAKIERKLHLVSDRATRTPYEEDL